MAKNYRIGPGKFRNPRSAIPPSPRPQADGYDAVRLSIGSAALIFKYLESDPEFPAAINKDYKYDDTISTTSI